MVALHQALQSATGGAHGAKDKAAAAGDTQSTLAVEVAESPPTPSITPCRRAALLTLLQLLLLQLPCQHACTCIMAGATRAALAAPAVPHHCAHALCRAARTSSASSGPSVPTRLLPMAESPPETPLQMALKRPVKMHSLPPSRRITPQVVQGPARPVEAWKNLQVEVNVLHSLCTVTEWRSHHTMPVMLTERIRNCCRLRSRRLRSSGTLFWPARRTW